MDTTDRKAFFRCVFRGVFTGVAGAGLSLSAATYRTEVPGDADWASLAWTREGASAALPANWTNETLEFAGRGTVRGIPALPSVGRLDEGVSLRLAEGLALNGTHKSLFGRGTVVLGRGQTLHLGGIGTSLHARSAFQNLWTNGLRLEPGATARFTTPDARLAGEAVAFLRRIRTDAADARVELFAGAETASPYAALAGTTNGVLSFADTLATPRAGTFALAHWTAFQSSGHQTVGCEGPFGRAAAYVSAGYDQRFASAKMNPPFASVPHSAGAHTVSVYADLAQLTDERMMTLGGEAALRVTEGAVQLCALRGGRLAETGVIAPRRRGFHLYTVLRSERGVALWFDGTLCGIDYRLSVPDAACGECRLGAGLLVRMVRTDEGLMSDGTVGRLARAWPPLEGMDTRPAPTEALKADDEITGRNPGAARTQTEAFQPDADAARHLPNVILVLADDLGYGDVGWTHQNARHAADPSACWISTPNLDRLASEGLVLGHHYAAAPVCAPSRASLLTGTDQGRCSLRDNAFDYPILEERTLGTVMRAAGYATHAIGKWGVAGGGESGLPRTAHPLDRGFDHFYGFIDHLAGHTYYHYDELLNGAYMGIVEDRRFNTASAEGLYSTDLFIARAKKVLADQAAENRRTGVRKPVFMFLAVNAVHGSGGQRTDGSVPCKKDLQVPGRPYPAANGKARGLGGGADWDWLQANREPAADRNTWLYGYTAPEACPGFDREAKRRYATTVTRLDEGLADLVQTLKDIGEDENTVIIFTSDNGPTCEYGTDVAYFDSNGPFDGCKRHVYEGGLRVPTFVRWPGGIAPGTRDDRPSMNSAWCGYLEQIARGERAPRLSGEVYVEYFFPGNPYGLRKPSAGNSQIMARLGNYVGLRADIRARAIQDLDLQLYDVVRDLAQEHPLVRGGTGDWALPAGEYDALQRRMKEAMAAHHVRWTRADGFRANAGSSLESDGRPYDR